MSIVITVDSVDYTVPSSAADTNWAAQVIALWQALAVAASAGANAVLLTGDQSVAGHKTWNGATSLIGELLLNNGGISCLADDTTGTPGNAAFSQMMGRSAIASSGLTCTMTGVLPAGAFVIVWLESADDTATSISCQPAVDSFTVSANANATNDTNFGWLIIIKG